MSEAPNTTPTAGGAPWPPPPGSPSAGAAGQSAQPEPGPGFRPPQGPPGFVPEPGVPGWMPPPSAPMAQWGPPSPAPAQWGPPPQWAPPPALPMLPVEPREYPSFWRAPGIKPWRPVLAILLGAVGFFLISLVIGAVGLFVEAAVSGSGVFEASKNLAEGAVTPTVFLSNSVSLALLVPLCFLLSRVVGQRGGWLSSVVGRVRWGWLMRCFAVSFVAVATVIVVGSSIEGWGELGLSVRPGWWWLLIGIIIVTPFQAAGEEYLIRGVLNRGVASLIPGRIVGAIAGGVLSSIVFMFLHGAGDVWLNITYFSMGMLFSYLTWRTGGLEAAIAMHAANNLIALAFLPFQDISSVFDRAAGVGDASSLFQLLFLGAATAVIVHMGRRRDIARAGALGASLSR